VSVFVVVPADEMAILVEVVVEGCVHCAEILQCLHLPKPQHGAFSSSDREM
jgi:hypothetical protein